MTLGGIDPVGGLIGLGSFLLAAVALGVTGFAVSDPNLAKILKALTAVASAFVLGAAVLFAVAVTSDSSATTSCIEAGAGTRCSIMSFTRIVPARTGISMPSTLVAKS